LVAFIAPIKPGAAEEQKMARQIVFTAKAAKPPATYSQAIKAAGLVFVSGTAPADPITGAIVGATIQEQTRQCLTNVAAILEEAGSSLDKLVSATVILAEEDDFAGMNEEWLRWFPSDPPARQGAKLPVRVPGLKISIAAIASA
jgi:2-iminobutanoate/2-iminopropanoate deaminase